MPATHTNKASFQPPVICPTYLKHSSVATYLIEALTNLGFWHTIWHQVKVESTSEGWKQLPPATGQPTCRSKMITHKHWLWATPPFPRETLHGIEWKKHIQNLLMARALWITPLTLWELRAPPSGNPFYSNLVFLHPSYHRQHYKNII